MRSVTVPYGCLLAASLCNLEVFFIISGHVRVRETTNVLAQEKKSVAVSRYLGVQYTCTAKTENMVLDTQKLLNRMKASGTE